MLRRPELPMAPGRGGLKARPGRRSQGTVFRLTGAGSRASAAPPPAPAGLGSRAMGSVQSASPSGGVSASAKQLKDLTPGKGQSVLDFVLGINYYYFVFFDHYPLFLHFSPHLIKFSSGTW